MKEGDIGFKKPKVGFSISGYFSLITTLQTKKKRSSRRAPAELEIAGDEQMDVDLKPITPRARDLDINFVDDDDLQAALARSRKAKLYKAKKRTPEELAKKSALLLRH